MLKKTQRGLKDIHALNFDDGSRKGGHTLFTRAMRKVAAVLSPTFTLFSVPHSLQNQACSLLSAMQQLFGAEFVQTQFYSLSLDAAVSGLHLLKGDNEMIWLERPFPLGCKLHVQQK